MDSLQRTAAAANVELLGSRSDVATLLPEFDVLVFTSIPEGEGMPGVLIEAGMCGLAVVTTDVPGARDVIDDDHTGYVVPPEPLQPLVEAVANLVNNHSLTSGNGCSCTDPHASRDSPAPQSPIFERAAAQRNNRPVKPMSKARIRVLYVIDSLREAGAERSLVEIAAPLRSPRCGTPCRTPWRG